MSILSPKYLKIPFGYSNNIHNGGHVFEFFSFISFDHFNTKGKNLPYAVNKTFLLISSCMHFFAYMQLSILVLFSPTNE